MIGGDLSDHLTIVGGRTEHLRIERNGGYRLALDCLGEFAGLDLRALWHTDLVEAIKRHAIIGPGGLQQIVDVLGIAQVRTIGCGDDENVIGIEQGPFGPSGPEMRDVQHDAGHGGAQRVENGVKCFLTEVIDFFQRGRRGQQAEMIGTFGQ